MVSTIIDYSPFLHFLENGSLWWRLEDAIKLGAGYLPVRDDEQNLNPVLRAKNNQIRANERTLLSEFNQDHYTEANLQLLVRDDGRYVEAREFLNWLTQHISLTQSDIPFPNDLIRAVRCAAIPPVVHMPASFESLTVALDVWFDKPNEDMPDELRHRVETDFSPMPWDNLSPDQRRSVAAQWDYQHDPAMENNRQYWWDFYQRMQALEGQIEQWNFIATPTATDLAQKENRLAELQRELGNMKKEEKQPYRNSAGRSLHKVDVQAADVAHSTDRPEYIAYPKAMKLLAERLDATPEELAAWLFFGSGTGLGGLTAYLNAKELDPPPKFYYNVGNGDSFDYLSPLMACWFREEDIANFKPDDRYITGSALIERWSKQLGIQPEAYILAKIRESRLQDYHPLYGGTKATSSESEFLPPLETGLFALSHIEEIEAEDFDAPNVKPSDAEQVEVKLDGSIDQGSSGNPCAIFLSMMKLTADEVSIAFVGDKSESGIGANNILEITARSEIRRVALVVIDLVDRRRNSLNSQGVILLGMTQKKKLSYTGKSARKISRLRQVFYQHLGISADPFHPYRQGAGWEPRFKICDKRGAADERAKRDAELRTVSYEKMLESGERVSDLNSTHQSFGSENDDADEWIKDNTS